MKKKITDIWKFLTYDIWRITEDEVTRTKFSLYNIIKTVYLCINRFTKDRMANKASALTYSTLLAIVPILAILFAVARGFGFDNLMEHQFRNGFGGNTETTEAILSFVNSYLSQTKGGIFIGVGLVMLLWTVINLVSNIEITFNRIWEVKKARSMYRKITDYFSMFLLMPILIVVSGGLSLFMSTILSFVNSYLSQTKGGIFIGVGLVMLLWTVINLVSNIEITFNRIWEVKKARSMYRKITDYFSMFLLMPILIVVSGGLSLFMSTILKQMDDFVLLAPVMKFMIRLIPFVLTWLMFTGLYIFMPNTKVKFKHALIAGILAGSAYQAFQFLYINSQLWVSKYNAIYGSFAALPLFLLWLQISWTICLFGAELTYAGQNIRSFSFDQDTRNISRRYRDFISILIMSLIAKRFEKNEPPYTAAEISEEHQIPIRLTNQVLYQLQEIELIHEVVTDEKSEEIGYQPSMDINQLNVAVLLDRLDTYGSENFKIDKDEEFNDEWKVLTESREEYYKKASKVLLKDL